jgi:FAD synthase
MAMSRLFRDVEGGSRCPHGSVVCIGAFDGLHLGHQALVRHTVARARALGVEAVVLSFEPLPREFFAPAAPPPRLLLTHAKASACSRLAPISSACCVSIAASAACRPRTSSAPC